MYQNRINKNKVVGDRVREIVPELLEDNIYDLADEFSSEEIANAAANLAKALVTWNSDGTLTMVKSPVNLFALGLTWRAEGHRTGSWISCSDDNGTGVGRMVCQFFDNPSEITNDEVLRFIETMNEAYYLLKQDNL